MKYSQACLPSQPEFWSNYTLSSDVKADMAKLN